MIAACSTVLLLILASSPQAADSHAAAERLAANGSNAAALAGFQKIVSANPDDIEARVWIGRLHAAMGHPQRAIDVFRSVLAVQPQHIQALVELGNALVAMGRYGEAGEVLDRAEKIAPDSPAVLAAQGRLHGGAGQRELSRAYYLRAAALEPGNRAAREGALELRAANAHRVEAGYVFEHFDRDVSATHAGDLTLNLRVTDRFRVFGTGQRERKFSRLENRGGGGVEWGIRRGLRVRAGGLFANDTVFFPRRDAFASLSTDAGRATWTFMGRFADFRDASLWIGGPAVLLRLPRGVESHASYYRQVTKPEGALSIGGNSGTIGMSAALPHRARLGAGYTRGIDHLELLTADRLGAFTANTWSAGLELWASRLLSFNLSYDYQERPGEIHVHRAGIRLVQRF